jgi:geranylgeranyl diphosphate synthase type II
MSMHEALQVVLPRLVERIDTALSHFVPEKPGDAGRLNAAMRHSLLAPGKRARGLLVLLAAGHGRGAGPEAAITPACAIEMVHAASLVFDDLPCMDDATVRRGRKACHCAFDEATAVLSGIGLLNLAFSIIAREERLDGACRADLARMLSDAIGLDGLVAGQMMDLRAGVAQTSASDVELIHARKTGALFAAAVEMGGRASARPAEQLALLHGFGLRIGVAFQTFDDLIDTLASREAASKNVGADAAKPTLVKLHGVERAGHVARAGMQSAIADIAAIGPDGEILGAYADHLMMLLNAKMDRDPARSSAAGAR